MNYTIKEIEKLCEQWNTKYAQHYKSLCGLTPSSKIKITKTSFENYFALDFVDGARIWLGNIDEIQRYVSLMLRDFDLVESHKYILYSPKRYLKQLKKGA